MTLAMTDLADLGLILDGALVVLLLITIGFALRLNAKLSLLRAGQAEMERLSGALRQATREAEEGLAALQGSAGKLSERLGQENREAGALIEELRYLAERGGNAAEGSAAPEPRQAREADARWGGATLAQRRAAARAARLEAQAEEGAEERVEEVSAGRRARAEAATDALDLRPEALDREPGLDQEIFRHLAAARRAAERQDPDMPRQRAASQDAPAPQRPDERARERARPRAGAQTSAQTSTRVAPFPERREEPQAEAARASEPETEPVTPEALMRALRAIR